ncbi:hypothetical protein L2D08_14860 [Domibacillus sp. PGB-M46]|uniref:hypothetical protein n=1 Tax=Domibacillus sp. PGB-M46 TaxID=2910255 RepID=UPI001F55FCB3|nr:hypothetical protein [Domibacillus sp. PGB-M46]MCI2255651.1 hypothetical protein [Domibacillus sp. PGB-M46]
MLLTASFDSFILPYSFSFRAARQKDKGAPQRAKHLYPFDSVNLSMARRSVSTTRELCPESKRTSLISSAISPADPSTCPIVCAFCTLLLIHATNGTVRMRADKAAGFPHQLLLKSGASRQAACPFSL